MKEIVVISGKGGTGKTSISASLAYIAGKEAVIADCDVDAADMHLLLNPNFSYVEDFYSGKMAYIDNMICTNCGECKSICRFDAIQIINANHIINEIDCEGCSYCANICPVEAIEMKDNLTGEFYISKTRLENTLVHAKLRIGAENSGKLVTKVRKEAKKIAEQTNTPFLIIDGTPGIGCPVIASITGADYVVIVTEPTVSGLHDMKRACKLVKDLGIKLGCIINKEDLNKQVSLEIKDFLKENNIELLTELPYDNVFTEAITQGNTVVECSLGSKIYDDLKKCWEKLKNIN
jgi:MinD superfamily P-loop ATPase